MTDVCYKEENVLFNDTLNTFYFMVIWHRTYGIGPLSKDRNPASASGIIKGCGICYPVCGRVHITDLLLLIKKE